MSHSSRKIIAVLMLLWLPLFSGNALAATIAMQLQRGGCHEAAVSQAMSHDDTGQHHQHHGKMPAAEGQSSSCNACGFCHLAGTGYLAMPAVELVAVQTAARETTPYLVAFHSFISAPLVPPPLVLA